MAGFRSNLSAEADCWNRTDVPQWSYREHFGQMTFGARLVTTFPVVSVTMIGKIASIFVRGKEFDNGFRISGLQKPNSGRLLKRTFTTSPSNVRPKVCHPLAIFVSSVVSSSPFQRI